VQYGWEGKGDQSVLSDRKLLIEQVLLAEKAPLQTAGVFMKGHS
jgi:hypothetical protein